MVLNSWDDTRPFSQRKIADEIYDSGSQATYNSELVLYPRTKGFESYSFQGTLQTLKDLVGKDIPVIVLTKTIKQLAKGHYRVVIGFDDDKGQIIFHDPFFGGRRAMKVKTFMKVWELGKGRNQSRWMMVVVPGQSPFPFPALQNDPLTSINLATAYYRRSDFTRSREMWEKVKGSLNEDPYPLYSLGMVSLRQGQVRRGGGLCLLKPSAWTRKALTPTMSLAWLTPIKGRCSRLSSPSVRLFGWPPRRGSSERIICKSGPSISKGPVLNTFKKRRSLMKRRVKIGSVLLMIMLLSGFAAAAIQKPAAQQAGTTAQLVIGAQDVITASDAGGGAISSRDLIVIITICVVILVVVLVL